MDPDDEKHTMVFCHGLKRPARILKILCLGKPYFNVVLKIRTMWYFHKTAEELVLKHEDDELVLTIRVVLQRAGAACARPLKGGVWPSLPANASDRKDSFSTSLGPIYSRDLYPTVSYVQSY
jgi:hypothetical protein